MEQPLRVLHLITGLGAGGTQRWLAELLARLPRERFAPRVVSLLPFGETGTAAVLRGLGIPVESLLMRRGAANPAALFRLMRLLRVRRPQVVQTWLYHADLLGLVAARLSLCGAAVSWGLRCGFMDLDAAGPATRRTVQLCARLSIWPQAVTANSRAAAAEHLALGYRPRYLAVLENGVDGVRFRPDEAARQRLRTAWGVPEGAAVVGLVARADPIKDHAAFCRAAAAVLTRHPGTRFVFCGEGTQPGGPLDGLVARYGLAGAALRLGPREDVAAVDAALDVAALSSRGEGFPNALAEGLACGVPAATLDVGDARRIVGPGGFVADALPSAPGAATEIRAGALAECLERILALRPEERQALGAAGRKYVLRRYGMDAAVRRWAEHFTWLAK